MSTSNRTLDPAVVARLVLDTEPWLSCDDCFRLVDPYVDALATGSAFAPAKARTPMAVHLRACPACLEEATTLVVLAAEDLGADAGYAVSLLEQAVGTPAGRGRSGER